VVRDVGRVLGWSYGDGDRIAKMIPTELGITLAGARQKNLDLKAAIENEPATKQLWEYSTFLEGLTRGVGIHAAGVVIGDCELDKHIPLTRGNDGEVVTQYAMKPLTDVGMLKMDFLGLKTLTVIQDAVTLIRAHTPDFDIDDIILEDKPTFDLLNAGETIGVFQLESGGMIALCKQFGVDRIEDIIALIALYRPGPMDLIPDFIDRKKGKKKVKYLHPLLEQVSKETHGILIYQEQVQKAANVLAGYSLGDADLLRRAMGKKSPEEMAKQRIIFVEGAAKVNNIPKKQADEIFDLLEKFAGYGFNKSHSAAYGLISYQTAFLKANYAVEFMAALLSNEINNTDKISVFVAECKRMGVEILPPDVNHSELKFAPEAGDASRRQVRFGLAAVKNVGGAAMRLAINDRRANGKFESLDDFARRLDTKAVNKKILESLIRSGAFDFGGEDRARMLARIDQVTASAASAQKDRMSGQVSLFGDMEVDFGAPPAELDADGEAIEVAPMSKDDMFTAEKELLGFYVTGHPLDAYAGAIAKGKFEQLGVLEQLRDGKKYEFAGSIASLDMRYTKKGGQPFAIMTLEDFTGQAEVMVWNETWVKVNEVLAKGAVVKMKAKVETDSRSESKRLTAENISLLEKVELPPGEDGNRSGLCNGNGNGNGALTLHLKPSNCTTEDLLFIRSAAEKHRGSTPLRLRILTAKGKAVSLKTENKFAVDNCPQLRSQLERWLG
jgi:DNA polymerase-3 subunit alpha